MVIATKRKAPPELAERLKLLNEIPRDVDAVAKFAAKFNKLVKDLRDHGMKAYSGESIHLKGNIKPIRRKNLKTQYDNTFAIFQLIKDEFKDFPLTVDAIGFTTNAAEIRLTLLRLERENLLTSIREFPGSNETVTGIMLNIVLERLFICPVCEDIKWIGRLGTTKTCGKEKCIQKGADQRRGKSGKKGDT